MGRRARDESPVTSGGALGEFVPLTLGMPEQEWKSSSPGLGEMDRITIRESGGTRVCIVQSTAATHSHIPSLAGSTGYPHRGHGQAQIRTWSWHQDLHSTEEFILAPDEPWPGCFRFSYSKFGLLNLFGSLLIIDRDEYLQSLVFCSLYLHARCTSLLVGQYFIM